MVSKHIDSIISNRAIINEGNLSGIIIGPDALLDELKNKSLYQAYISNSNLSYARISGSMSNSHLTKVDLTRSILDRCVLFESYISECDFSHSKLVVAMNDSTCEDSNFSGARFSSGSVGLEYGGRRVKFINCNFTSTVFDKVEFRASKFIDCIFTEAKFKKCDFRGVKFEGGILPSVMQFENMDVPKQFI